VAVVGAAVGLAAVSGAASHLAARWIYLVLIAPVAVGFAVGAPLSAVIRRVRMAAPVLAATIAALAVLLALTLHLSLDYAHDRHNRIDDIEEMRELKMDIGYELEEIEAEYAESMAQLSVTGYLSRRFGLAGDSAPPTNGFGSSLGPIGSIGVWALELLLGGFIAVSFARQQAREPACGTCGAWRVHHKLGVAAYGVSKRLVDALLAENADGAAAMLTEPDTREHVELILLACPRGHDADAGVLRVVDHRRDKRRRPSLRLVGDYAVDDAEVAALRDALVEAAA
jgi:hypothetical protein